MPRDENTLILKNRDWPESSVLLPEQEIILPLSLRASILSMIRDHLNSSPSTSPPPCLITVNLRCTISHTLPVPSSEP